MKLFDLRTLASTEGGEYVLGAKDLHIQTCYLIYGYLETGEGRRLIKPGESHDEILCAIDGPILMHTTRGQITLPQAMQSMSRKTNLSLSLIRRTGPRSTSLQEGGGDRTICLYTAAD